MKEFREIFCVFLFVAISYWTTTVPAECPPGQFECMNERCISEDLVNNTVNDCEDNSDEGAPPNAEICRYDPITHKRKFKCNSGDCTNMADYLDGSQDCMDKSDEHKVLGSICYIFANQCCPCNASIPESFCLLHRPQPYANKQRKEGVCRCLSGRRNNTLGTECIVRRIGDECDLDPDCFDAIPFTACLHGKCDCAPGRYLVVNLTANESSTCILRKIGDNCSQADDCSMAVNDSTCSNNRCRCNHGYEPTKGLTRCRIPQIDSFECSSDSECRNRFENTTCNQHGFCVCLPAFYPNDARDVCLRYALDSPCSASASCQASINNTQCLGGRCSCANGYYGGSSDPLRCVPRVVGMDGCLTDADCSAVRNSRCSANRTCTCLPGHLAAPGGATCSLRRIGDHCQTIEDCSAAVNRSACAGAKCRCEDGFKESGGDRRLCVPIQVGDECYRDAECRRAMANSYCVLEEQRCDCLPGYEPNEPRSGCVRAQVDRIGCRNSSWCQGLVKNSVCASNGRCVCGDGFHLNVDGTGCALLKVGVLPCSSDDFCSKAMNSTLCGADDLCVCQPGFYANIAANHCVNTSVGKTTCHRDDERTCRLAIYKSECIGGRCQCAAGYKVLGGRSCVATQLGQACQVDEHCTAFIDHSACVNQTCVCAPGYNSTDGITCIPLQDFHGVCTVPSFCPGWCWVLIGFFIGTFLASVILGGILWKKNLRKEHLKATRVSPIGMEYGMDHRWQLEWSNRPPAHIPVMYKSPSMRAPDEIYGDLLNIDFNAMLFDRPDAKSKKSLPESYA